VLLTAPAKLNLCLYVGARRDDGLHEIRSLFEPLSLADELEVSDAAADEVVCPAVGGENLAAKALTALREHGWDGPPQQIRIRKRIPIAGGLGGGSADAAAVLRLAGRIDGVEEVAMALGADILSQLRPALSLVSGAGERVEPLPPPGKHAVVLIPQQAGLSTAEVYAEADRLGLRRDPADLEAIEERLRSAAGSGASPLDYRQLLSNDLEPAALSLRPEIGDSLAALREAGAAHALITGSGPTAFGLFSDIETAEAAAASLGAEAIASSPGAP
jgi:4-diphosphocytidyl-2-C-methyl-D-erythritol kinase